MQSDHNNDKDFVIKHEEIFLQGNVVHYSIVKIYYFCSSYELFNNMAYILYVANLSINSWVSADRKYMYAV